MAFKATVTGAAVYQLLQAKPLQLIAVSGVVASTWISCVFVDSRTPSVSCAGTSPSRST